MPRIVENSRDYRADTAWGALDLAEIEGATVRLHWTDKPYKWHMNDGAEAFVVLDGSVDMHYREGSTEKVVELKPGSVFVAEEGDEHIARPRGEARILVVERKGSV
jgi:mannose-6-phosphate isomerase-like protein (cupin superfamily)